MPCTSRPGCGSTTTNPASSRTPWNLPRERASVELAPPSWRPPANDLARALAPDPGDFRHHRGGENNGDAHFQNLLVHQQVVLPVTGGRLNLGPWQQLFYCEFDGGRPKRLIVKVIGD